MEKLISKNPIQRFKQGRQIKRFKNPSSPITIEDKTYVQVGTSTWGTPLLRGEDGSLYKRTPTSIKKVAKKGEDYNVYGRRSDKGKIKFGTITIKADSGLNSKTNNQNIIKPKINSTQSSVAKQQINPKNVQQRKKEYNKSNSKTSHTTKTALTSQNSKTSNSFRIPIISAPSQYITDSTGESVNQYTLSSRGRLAPKADWNYGRTAAIQDINKDFLTELGIKEGATTADIQKAMQNYANNAGLELKGINDSNFIDGKWGNQTQSAWNTLYNIFKNNISSNNTPISQNAVWETFNTYTNPGMQFNKAATRGFLGTINAKNTNDLISGIMGMDKDNLTKQQIYNRAGITTDMNDQAIRDRLGNTFANLGIHGHLGGNDRRRFRNWFNTQETKQPAQSSTAQINVPLMSLNFDREGLEKIKKQYSFLKKGGLIPKSPVEQFKLRGEGISKFYHRGSPSSLKNGGSLIPKYQNAPGPLVMRNPFEGYELQVPSTDYRQPLGTTVGIKTKTINLPQITITGSSKQARANRVKEASKKNSSVANLQNALYKIGAYKGVKDRHGNQATFSSSVDGIRGRITNAAIANAKAMGYDVDESTGKVTKKKVFNPIKPETEQFQLPVKTKEAWTPSQINCEKVVNPITGKITTECAEYANSELNNYKRGNYYQDAYGDAWTRVANGDYIENGYNYLEEPDLSVNIKNILRGRKNRIQNQKMYKYSTQAADKFKEHFDINSLDPNEVYMVNMYFKGSPNIKKAFENGTGIKGKQKATRGTHTGNVWFDGKTWKVSHNIHGQEHTDNLSEVLGSGLNYGITAMSRVRHNKFGGVLIPKNPIDQFKYKRGGILKAQEGLKTSAPYNPSKPNPMGYDLSHIGIKRTGTQKSYGNSDSLPIAQSLEYLQSRSNELMDRYHLTLDEFRTLLGLTQGVEWKESNGGLSQSINPQTNNIRDNKLYRTTHLGDVPEDLYGLWRATGRHIKRAYDAGIVSEGLGSVKVKDLKNLPTYSKTTDFELGNYPRNSPQFGGLSTFASLAQRFNYIKEQAKQNPSILYNEDGSINDTTLSLIATGHNQGMDNIRKDIRTTIKTGQDKLSQYQNFSYPSSVMQVVKGHDVSYSKPYQLDEIIVKPNK